MIHWNQHLTRFYMKMILFRVFITWILNKNDGEVTVSERIDLDVVCRIHLVYINIIYFID